MVVERGGTHGGEGGVGIEAVGGGAQLGDATRGKTIRRVDIDRSAAHAHTGSGEPADGDHGAAHQVVEEVVGQQAELQ